MFRVQTVGGLYQHTSLVALSSMRGLKGLVALQMMRAGAIVARRAYRDALDGASKRPGDEPDEDEPLALLEDGSPPMKRVP